MISKVLSLSQINQKMDSTIQRKCNQCGTWNLDVDFCANCNAAISIKAIEKIEATEKKAIADAKPKDKFDVIFEKLKHHPFFLVRWVYYILNSIFMLFMGIGSLIAYFIAWTAG
ncbi:MAG: hypothetical protein AB8B74_11420 [Crocinitomicaceae bacterium]